MKRDENRRQTLALLALIGQLGLNIIAPPLLLMWLAWRFLPGTAGMAAALIVGLISSGCGAARLLRRWAEKTGKNRKDAPQAFNRHE